MSEPKRRRWSNALLAIGSAATFIGLASAMGGIGLTILAFVQLPFTGAVILVRSRRRIAAALDVWGFWFYALYHVLT